MLVVLVNGVSSCVYVICFFYFFFFKQKTAYEIRISDWSSDVCSSDLDHEGHVGRHIGEILDRLGKLQLQPAAGDTVEFVDDKDEMRALQIAEDVAELARSEVAAWQEFLEIVGPPRRRADGPSGEFARHLAEEAAEHLLEGNVRAAGAAQNIVVALLGGCRNNVGERSLADAPGTEDDDVGLVLFDRGNHPLDKLKPTREEVPCALRVRRCESFAQPDVDRPPLGVDAGVGRRRQPGRGKAERGQGGKSGV